MDDETRTNDRLKSGRRWILWLLKAGAILLLILILAGTLTLILSAGGDQAGATGVLGIVYVAGAGLGLNIVALVIVTASCVARMIESVRRADE